MFALINLDFVPIYSFAGYVARSIPTLYMFVFYFLLLGSYKDLDEKRKLEAAQAALSQQLTSVREQISLLNEAQNQTAIYQHNMRHHLTAISAFLSANDPKQAEEYIKKVQNDVEAITLKRFCENELVNLLCSSFAHKTAQRGIRLTVEAGLPQQLAVSDTELCSILSNGLENALYAVSELEPAFQWIKLYCGIQANKLLIEIQNPYAGEIMIQDGLPVSKREGHGYGCRSIQTIAMQYNGLCLFEAEQGVFTLRVVLPLHS